MIRCEAIAVIGGAAVGWPRIVRAQQQAIPAIGYLSGGSPDAYSRVTAAFSPRS